MWASKVTDKGREFLKKLSMGNYPEYKNHKKWKCIRIQSINKKFLREFPEGTVVRTQYFHCWGLGLIPGKGTKILQRKAQSKKRKSF